MCWMNAERKNLILLSIISKTKILDNSYELLSFAIPAFIGFIFLSSYTGKILGNNIEEITSIAKQVQTV